MATTFTLDNTDPPSNRTTASNLAFTDQQVWLSLTARNFDFSTLRTDGRDLQVYDVDGTTPIGTSLRLWKAGSFGIRYVGRIAIPTGNAPTYGPYVQCEAVICADLGIANPPHTVYGYATQAGRTDGLQEGGLICLDKTGAMAFAWSAPGADSINSLDVGDVDGDGVLELLVGTSRISRKLFVVKASAQAASPNSSLWSFSFPAGNSYVRAAKAGKLRSDLTGNQVVVAGSQGTDGASNGSALGKISLLNSVGVEQWTKSLNASVTNHTIQDCQVVDLDGTGLAVYCGQAQSIYRLSLADGSTASGWPYTHDGTRTYYSIAAGYITGTTVRQIVGVCGVADGTTHLGHLTVVTKDGVLVWDRPLHLQGYGVRCADIDGDGYDEIIVVSGTDSGAVTLFRPPNQGWGLLQIFDRNGNELCATSLTCAAKTIAYAGYTGTSQKYIQVSGDDGWLHRFAIDSGNAATVKMIVPAVAWKAAPTLSIGSTGTTTHPPSGDALFDFSGADGSTPANLTARIGTWTIQGNRLQSPSDAQTATGATIEAGYVSTEAFDWEYDAYKTLGDGSSTYYNGVRYRCSGWSSNLPDGYIFQHSQAGLAALVRTSSGTSTALYTAFSATIAGSTFVATDKMSYRLCVSGDWHAAYYRKNGTGGWLELFSLLDVNASKKSTAGTIAFLSQRGQSQYLNSTIHTYVNLDGNSGPGPVPMAYRLAPTAAWYTLSSPSPSSGVVGVPSGAFTVAPDASFDGTITITPTGGGLTTPIVLTFTTGAPQTFTITPTTTGTVTLTGSNSGGLTNPGSVTYTVTAVVPPSTTTQLPAITYAFAAGRAASMGYTVYNLVGDIVSVRTMAGISFIGNAFVAVVNVPWAGNFVVDWDDGTAHDAMLISDCMVEPNVNVPQSLAVILAAVTGKTSGAGTTFYDPTGTQPRLVGTVVGSDRTSTTITPPS